MRKIEVSLEELLDLITAVQFEGLQQVHEFVGDLVGQLTDGELREYVQILSECGYDQEDRDEADLYLRRWRERCCGRKPEVKEAKAAPAPEPVKESLEESDEPEAFQT